MSLDALSPVSSHAIASLSPGGDPHAIGRLPAGEQVKAAAGQFEAILVRQFLEQSVGNLLGGESGGPAANVYGYLLTDVLANQLTAGGGLGLGGILEKQLTPRVAAAEAAVSAQGNP
jgi:flagellar protein FlgJ